ncbi:hypothetical protein CO251_04565 [Sulfobacillus sp. hq2]|nr:hypothetical protein CO251_04565 [Sulfobacillus sp. hq2]
MGTFGTVSLPASWNPTPNVSTSPDGSVGYFWSSGSDAFTFRYFEPYGANHNATLQSDPFDPSLSLPTGTAVTSHPAADEWNFQGNGLTGAIFTTPSMQGAYVIWVSGPDTSVLQSILTSVYLYGSDFTNGQGG